MASIAHPSEIPNLPQVDVLYGGMGCGKTEALLQRIRRLRVAKRTVLVATHKSDTRYSEGGELATHNNDKIHAHAIGDIMELKPLLDGVEYLVVDEVQFFARLSDAIMELHGLFPGLRFILAGLVQYSNGKPFGELYLFLPWARCKQLTAVCMFCFNEDATMTACIKQKKADVQVGAVNDDEIGYRAACISCWSKHTVS